MRSEAGSFQRLWHVTSPTKKRAAAVLALLLVFSIIMVRLSVNTTRSPPEEVRFDNCAKDTAFQNGKNSTVYDDFMDTRDPTCNRYMEVNQETLGIEKKCSKDPLNFFMFWSTKREDFKLKNFRVIDSIFMHHPNARLHFFTKSMSIADFAFYTDRYDIVHHRLEPEKILKDTPLDRWAQNIDEWKKGSNFYSHITDAMRIALLWKYGGVYLDTDAPVLKSLKNVRNTVGIQHPTTVYQGGEINGAILAFDRMHPFLYFAMHDLVSNYEINRWDTAGPRVITRSVTLWSTLHPFMVRWIPVHKAGQMPLPNEPLGTPAISVFADQYAFYPHSWWTDPRIDTKPVDDPEVAQFRKDVEERAYAYHYVNHTVQHTGIRKGIYLFEVLNQSCLFKCEYEDLEVNITQIIRN